MTKETKSAFIGAMLATLFWVSWNVTSSVLAKPLITEEITAEEQPKIVFRTDIPSADIPVLKNGCYLAAITYKDAVTAKEQLVGRDKWARIMYVDVTEVTGHAVCVFIYDGEWRVYDSMVGTKSIGTFDKDPTPAQIAQKLNPKYGNAKWLP